MIRRRQPHQPLADRSHPHWLTVNDMLGNVLESDPIEVGADLYQVLARAMARLTAAGWTIEDDGRYGSFFCHRNGVRRFVLLRPTDPAQTDLYGPSAHQTCPSCGD